MNKQIQIKAINVRNFKGIESFSLVVDGQNVKIYGDNAVGKTTLVDGFLWNQFDKDSQNKKDFSIKTLDKNNKEIHGLEHEVEVVFLIDGSERKFRKVFKEKWSKKRGSATAEFTGHTTDYYVDEVPVKKKEYADEVASIIDEEIFKLLTNPSYFNEMLHWKDRRKTLLELAGDITEEDVIATNSKLTKLSGILNGRSIENHRKIIAARRSEINNELEKIPVRIDEIQRSLPEVDGLDKSVLESEIVRLNNAVDEKLTAISNIRNGAAVGEIQKSIQQIDMELMDIKRDHESGTKDQVHQLNAKIQEENSNIQILNSKIENIKDRKRFNDNNIKNADGQLTKLRAEWTEINSQEFKHESDCECPTCGQSLPEEQVNEAREKALEQFNLKKSKRLSEIDTQGKQTKETKQKEMEANNELTKEYEKLSTQISDKEDAVQKLETQLETLKSSIIDITENADYVAKLKEKKKLNEEIQELRNETEKSIQNIQLEISGLKSERDGLQGQLARFVAVDQSTKRMEELMKQERDLAAEFEKLEEELYLTEEFIRTKVDLLTERINNRFKNAKFKLFEQQINGGLQETCETLFEGVPYSSGLNNAARINVGLDIINTLSEHYGITAPIFIDNAEAVTKFIDTNSQIISLIVSEADKSLRVEKEEVSGLIPVDIEVIS
ncbi:hypothetical protein ACQKM1_22575 [Peribacillus frigoritolerans]|uniref:hypothetical protein n=1 Tax=Peribacillus frigoritolerans TaxID=450367 RepID=UPI003CFDC579